MLDDIDQKTFIEASINLNILLIAKAGSGKTKSVVRKIKHHIQRKELTINTFRCLSYTNVAVDQLIEDGEGVLSKLNVSTIHKLAYNIIKTRLNRKEIRPLECIQEFIRLMTDPVEIENLRGKMQDFLPLKVIFVDEAQDTNKLKYEFLESLLVNFCPGCHLVLVGDPAQKIQDIPIPSFKKNCKGDENWNIFKVFKHKFRATLMHLRTNYRSTKSIIQAANGLMNFQFPHEQPMIPAVDAKEGECPTIFLGSSLEGELTNMVRWLYSDNSKRLDGTVLILCSRKEDIKQVVEILVKTNLVFDYKIKDDDEDLEIKKKTTKRKLIEPPKIPAKIHVRTIHGVKGQTCDTTVMIGFRRFLWNMEKMCQGSPSATEEWKTFFTFLINVAATRAKSYLAFIHYGPKSDIWWAYDNLCKNFYVNPYN